MLQLNQIRKLAKALTDWQIAENGINFHVNAAGTLWGSNAAVFHEPVPAKVLAKDPLHHAVNDGFIEGLWGGAQGLPQPAWPVELRDHFGSVLLRLSDGTWLDAQYVASAIKKTRSDLLKFQVVTRKPQSTIVLISTTLDEPILTIAERHAPGPDSWEWQLTNEDLPLPPPTTKPATTKPTTKPTPPRYIDPIACPQLAFAL